MRVRKPRLGPAAPGGGAFPQRLRKMAHSLSGARTSSRVAAVGLFGVAVLLVLAFADVPFVRESDEQFLERARLLRRTRELRRARDLRRRRAAARPPPDPPALALDAARAAAADARPRHRQFQKQLPLAHRPGASAWRRPRAPAARRTAGRTGRALPPASAVEVLWDEGSPAVKVCRIHQACLRADRGLLLPKWLESHQELLDECGVGEVQFMTGPESHNASGATAALDLFGVRPARYHIPHFLTDVLPMLYAAELLRPTFSDPATRHYACTAAQEKSCPDGLDRDRLRAALFVEDRVSKQPPDAWVPQLVAMLPLRPELVFPARDFAGGGAVACFRSVVTYPLRYVHAGRAWFGPRNELFAAHGISRESVLRSAEAGAVCEVQVVVLNRFGWVRRGGYLTGRDITNIEEIQARLQHAQQNERFRDAVRVDVAVDYFEDTGFREQVAIVQKADVIVGVHGAGLGNLLFAHQDAQFVEVLPFGYYAGPFDRLADALHLPYRSIVAEPDTDNFLDCINARAQQMNRPDIAVRGERMWKDALKTWAETGDRVLHSQLFNSPDTTPIKLCARSQRMRLDPGVAAKIILEAAEGVCNITASE